MGNEHDSWLQGIGVLPDKLKLLVGGGDAAKVAIPETEFNITVPVAKADLEYVEGEGSVAYKVVYKPAEEVEEAVAVKFKNGKPEVEAALKKKYGNGAKLSGGGTLSATEGSIGAELEIEGGDKAKTTLTFKVIKADANKVELKFAVLEWEQTYPLKDGDFTALGLKINYQASVAVKIEFSPDTKKIAEYLAKRFGLTVGEDGVTAFSGEALGFAIEGGLLIVAIGTVAGTINELSKAADERQLIGQITLATNMFTTGLGNALRGQPSPGGGWPGAGWTAGKKVFDDAIAKGKSKHPDWDDFAIRDKVIDSAGRIESGGDVQAAIKRRVGQGFWDRWIEANHGLGTFLGDAKLACGACFSKAVEDNDPDLAPWKAKSSLPEFMK